MGTRDNGLYCFKVNEKLQLTLVKHLTKKEGLTENFITWLFCDKAGVIWAGTSSGLDKIIYEKGNCIVDNITKSNNLYPFIVKIIEDNTHHILAIAQQGSLLKIGAAQKTESLFSPRFYISSIKAGNKYFAFTSDVQQFSYKENNIFFKLASPSFYNEKQIKYSYSLNENNTTNWTELTANAEISFANLSPGNYQLQLKVEYPAARYLPKIIFYSFTINPPYWQTWWFRLIISLLAVYLLFTIIKNYYKRKLEKQKNIIEKKQILEKERTRIAADIHDDLGAGLSTIRFLSEKVKRNSFSDVTKNDAEKIVTNSNELVQKMNELIWAMNEKNDTLADLIFYTRSYAAEYAEENNIRLHINLPEVLNTTVISGELRRNVFLTVKEILHNVVKHADAKNMYLNIGTKNNLQIHIKDDGVGFSKDIQREGNGLRNIDKRIKSMNGTLKIINENGVELIIVVPLK